MGLLHALNDLLARHAPGELVRLGKKRAFARNFFDLARQPVVLQETRNDLFGC